MIQRNLIGFHRGYLSSGFCNKNTIEWVTYNQQKFNSHSSCRLGSPLSRHQQIWCLVRIHILCPYMEEGLKKLFYKGFNLIHEGSTPMTIHLPKTLPLNILTFGITFQSVNFRRDTNIQSKTGIDFGCFLSKFAQYNLDL